jgi:rhodanese-related sulfurtransferase
VTTANAPVPDRSEVSVHEVPDLLDQGAVLLDVREPHEWTAGHAAAATHVPLHALSPDNVPDGEPLLVVCHIGGRSAMATSALRRAGYPAVNVSGGMEAWQQAGLPVVTDDGKPGQIV